MNRLHTLKNEFKMMFCKSSRLNRARTLSYFGFCATCITITSIMCAVLIPLNPELFNTLATRLVVPFFTLLSILLPCWWLGRRINDTGRSAKWLWATVLISLLLIFITAIFESATNPIIIAYSYALGGVGVLLIPSITLLVMMFKPGTLSENQFGSPPPENNSFTSFFCGMFFIVTCLGIICHVLEDLQNHQQVQITQH